MHAKEYQRLYGGGRTPEFVAQSDAATAKAEKKRPRNTERIDVADFKKRSRSKTEASPTNALTKAIIQMLTLEGCWVWRQNNGAVYDASFDGYRAGSVTPGISDVIGFYMMGAYMIAVEVKTGKDELSPEQIKFLDRIRAAGGFACEGRDVAQVRKEFITWRRSLPQ